MKYAETILDVGRLPLRRRDVNAMRLALDNLRADDASADVLLEQFAPHGGPSNAIAAAFNGAWYEMANAMYGSEGFTEMPTRHELRLLRARLALLLRCLLRVDAGNYGRSRCHCGAHVVMDVADRPDGTVYECWWCTRCREWTPVGEWPRRSCRPLWQDASGGQR